MILACLLSLEDRGFYLLGLGLPAVLLVLAECGWATTAICRIRRVGIPPKRVFSAGVLGVVASGAIALTLAFVFEDPLRLRLMAGAPRYLYLLSLSCLPAILLFRVSGAIARAMDQFNLQNRARVLGAALLPLSLCVAIPLVDDEFEVLAAVGCWAVIT